MTTDLIPVRYCVVCTEQITDFTDRARPAKARKCAACLDARRVAHVPHCVHCRTALADRPRIAWACQPLCSTGVGAYGHRALAHPIAETAQRLAPRPSDERKRSRSSEALYVSLPTLPDKEVLPRRCQILPRRGTPTPSPQRSGTIWERVQRLRK